MENGIYYLLVIKSAEEFSLEVDYLFLEELSSFLTVSIIHAIYQQHCQYYTVTMGGIHLSLTILYEHGVL